MSDRDRSPTSSQYDHFADDYADGGPYNEFYERPAMLELLGEVEGLKVLDVGCGSGVLTHRLLEAGASVIGIDASLEMLERAKARVGRDAQLQVHDLHDPLDWLPDETIDVVVASLVIHYVREWRPVLREFRRILRTGGRLVFSTHHPFMDFVSYNRPDYFEIEEIVDKWGPSGAEYEVRFWRRPLSVIVADLVDAGFEIEQLAEPRPDSLDALEERHRERLRTHPWFLFVVASVSERFPSPPL